MQSAQRLARVAAVAVLFASLTSAASGTVTSALAGEPSCGVPKHATVAITAAKMSRRELRETRQVDRRAKREARRREAQRGDHVPAGGGAFAGGAG